MNDPETQYGEAAVKRVLADGEWRHLPWPAYATTAQSLTRRGVLDCDEHHGQTVYRIKPKSRKDAT